GEAAAVDESAGEEVRWRARSGGQFPVKGCEELGEDPRIKALLSPGDPAGEDNARASVIVRRTARLAPQGRPCATPGQLVEQAVAVAHDLVPAVPVEQH
ncbi:MAG: hypothetical protein CFE32_21265, partial [Alphaproteobacteria bacterium PA3]